MSEINAGYLQNYQLGAIGIYSPNGEDTVDEPLEPKKLNTYENVVFIKKLANWRPTMVKITQSKQQPEFFYGPLYMAVLKKSKKLWTKNGFAIPPILQKPRYCSYPKKRWFATLCRLP